MDLWILLCCGIDINPVQCNVDSKDRVKTILEQFENDLFGAIKFIYALEAGRKWYGGYIPRISCFKR